MTITLPRLYPLQEEIATSSARWRIVATGRRTGKTTLGTYLLARYGLEMPGLTIWWVAPDFGTSFMAYERLKQYVGEVADFNETKMRAVFPTGTVIWFKSAEQRDRLRGEGVDFLLIDEAAHIKKLRYIWQAVLRPMLIDSRGSMIAFSTPNRRNLFYEWYIKGADPAYPDWQSWSFSTFDNPYLPANELEDLLEEYTEGSDLFRQEILGQFLDDGGTVFRKVRQAVDPALPTGPDPSRRYVAGIDWGKSTDFTVCIVLDKDTLEVAGMLRIGGGKQEGGTYIDQRERLARFLEPYRKGLVYIQAELNSIGEPNVELLRADYGLPVYGWTMTSSNKPLLIERLQQAFDEGAIRIPNDEILINELESFTVDVNPNTSRPTYGAPDGLHDDCVIALALAYRAARGTGLGLGIVEA